MERTTSLGFITTDVDSEFMGLGLRPKKKEEEEGKTNCFARKTWG